jgi:hypothetical protein
MINGTDKKIQINVSDLNNLGRIDFRKENDFLDDAFKKFRLYRPRYSNILGVYAPRIQDPVENGFRYLIGDISFYVSAIGSERSIEKAIESTKQIIIYNSFLKAFPFQMGITSMLFNDFDFSNTIIFHKKDTKTLRLLDQNLQHQKTYPIFENELNQFNDLYNTISSFLSRNFVFSPYPTGKFYNTLIKNHSNVKCSIAECSDFVLSSFSEEFPKILSEIKNIPQIINLVCFLERTKFEYLYYIPSFLINSNNISNPIRGNIALLSESRLLGHEIEDFTSFCNVLWLKLTMYEFDIKNQATKSLAVKNSVTNILSRNFSHNIGSHVMHNADLTRITAKLTTLSKNGYSTENELNAHRYAAALRSSLDRYIIERNEYLADVSESTMPAGNYAKFYREVIMPFVENFLLTDNIAKAEGIGFLDKDSNNRLQIRVFVEGKELVTYYNDKKNTEGGIQYGYPNVPTVQYNGQPLQLPYAIPFLKDNPKGFKAEHWDAFFNSKELVGEGRDVEIALPGVLGKHAFYSLVENFIRNTAKHNRAALQDADNLTVKIELTPLSIEDIEQHEFKSEHDAWKVTLSDDNQSWISADDFKALEKYVSDQLIVSQTGEPRKTGLGIADMVVSAAILAGSFNFDFAQPKYRFLTINKHNTRADGKSNFSYSFYLLKAKRIICLTEKVTNPAEEWTRAGITFVQKAEDLEKHMGRQAYRFAILDADLLDKEFKGDANKYEALLAKLPFRVIIKENPCDDCTNKPWQKFADQRRVSIYRGDIHCDTPDIFQQFCWEQWLRLFFVRMENRFPAQLHLYLEHEHKAWRDMPKHYNDLVSLNVYASQNELNNFQPDSSVNIIYDHHGQLLESFKGSANLLERDSYSIFDKNSADFARLIYADTDTQKVLPYMMTEAGLMRILVMDERVTEHSYNIANFDSSGSSRYLGNADRRFKKKDGNKLVKDKIFDLAWAGGVHIATHYQINDGKPTPLSSQRPLDEKTTHLTLKINTQTEEGKSGKIQFVSNLHRSNEEPYCVEKGHYDMIVIHRTILKQIQNGVKAIDPHTKFSFLNDIKDLIPFVVVDSGGGYPNEIRKEFDSRFKFLPFSFVSEHLLRDRIAKVGLSQLLMGLTGADQDD